MVAGSLEWQRERCARPVCASACSLCLSMLGCVLEATLEEGRVSHCCDLGVCRRWIVQVRWCVVWEVGPLSRGGTPAGPAAFLVARGEASIAKSAKSADFCKSQLYFNVLCKGASHRCFG